MQLKISAAANLGSFHLTASSTADAVSFTSRLTPRTVFAQEARSMAQTRAQRARFEAMVIKSSS
jgi:hypothetical protein